MTTEDNPAHGRTFTGWHMLILIVGFFAVVIGFNVYMVVMATESWTGSVVENSYTSGQGFNDKVALVREQQALGWHEELTYAGGALRLDVRGRTDAPVALEDVTVAVSRPIGTAGDQTLTLTRAADGSYAAPATLGHGRWNAVITASSTHGDYERHEQLDLP